MRTLLFAISLLIALCLAPLALAVSCFVYTEQELRNALDCLANCGQCQSTCQLCQHKHIIVPALDGQNNPVVIAFENPISIGQAHEGLELTINGTLQWAGDDGCSDCKLFQLSDATDVTINGSGTIKAPSNLVFPNPDDPDKNLPTAIRIIGACSNILIEGLTFQNLGDIVKQEDGVSQHIEIRGVVGTKLWNYGIWLGETDFVTIDNCQIGNSSGEMGAYRHHGIRVYGDDVTITDCEVYNTGAYGVWRANGDLGTIDGIVSNENIRLGPNHACTDGGGPDTGNPPQRTKRLTATNITTSGNVEVQNGSIGCILENIDAAQISIGNGMGGNTVPRPITRVRWTDTSVAPQTSTDPSGQVGVDCIGYDIREATCNADITGDGSIDVADLLAVINNWGYVLD